MRKLKMLVVGAFSVRHAVVITLALLLAGQGAVLAGSKPYSQIIVFGDSVSDTGNFYRMSGDLWGAAYAYPPSPPYWQGRFCNGPVWVEYLAEDLDMEASLDNYAVGGATTGTANNGSPFGGVQNQIALYLTSHRGDPDALYILWAGHNDVFIALATGNMDLSQVAINTVNNIRTLWAAGARHILVVNLSDMGKIPAMVSTDYSAWVSQLVAGLNEQLDSALHELAARGVHAIALDAFSFVDFVGAHPARFGFSDVTHAGILLYPAKPKGYVFWDDAHPTTKFHREFAQFALRHLRVRDHSDGHDQEGDDREGAARGGDDRGGHHQD